MRMCKVCRIGIEEDWKGEVCERCEEFKITKERMSDFAKIFIENDFEFEIKMFGDGEGYYFDFKNGVILNFHRPGRICFEYDEEYKEEDDA